MEPAPLTQHSTALYYAVPSQPLWDTGHARSITASTALSARAQALCVGTRQPPGGGGGGGAGWGRPFRALHGMSLADVEEVSHGCRCACLEWGGEAGLMACDCALTREQPGPSVLGAMVQDGARSELALGTPCVLRGCS